MKARYLYSELATAIDTFKRCKDNPQYAHAIEMWEERIDLLTQHLPSGSGLDSGTKLDIDRSHKNKLVFHTSFHHMNDVGYYDGWTDHTITVTPSLTSPFELRISGRNHNDIKDHLYQTFDASLSEDMTYYEFVDKYPQYRITSKWENEDGTASQCYQAWYVDGKRFWNNFQAAKNYASERMNDAFYNRTDKQTEVK